MVGTLALQLASSLSVNWNNAELTGYKYRIAPTRKMTNVTAKMAKSNMTSAVCLPTFDRQCQGLLQHGRYHCHHVNTNGRVAAIDRTGDEGRVVELRAASIESMDVVIRAGRYGLKFVFRCLGWI